MKDTFFKVNTLNEKWIKQYNQYSFKRNHGRMPNNEFIQLKRLKLDGRRASVVLDQEDLAVGKIRDYHPKARVLTIWGVEHEYQDSGQKSTAMRRWTKTAQPPVKSASRLCCSFLPKPTARQAEARARGPPCAGDACRLAVSDTGRCGAGLGLSAPRLMPFPLYLIASCTLSYPPSSAQMLPCL